MQFTQTIFSDSAIFIEKNTVENRLWEIFVGKKISIICQGISVVLRKDKLYCALSWKFQVEGLSKTYSFRLGNPAAQA